MTNNKISTYIYMDGTDQEVFELFQRLVDSIAPFLLHQMFRKLKSQTTTSCSHQLVYNRVLEIRTTFNVGLPIPDVS